MQLNTIVFIIIDVVDELIEKWTEIIEQRSSKKLNDSLDHMTVAGIQLD